MLSPDKKLSSERNDERRYSLAPIVQMRLLCVRATLAIEVNCFKFAHILFLVRIASA